ncbi:MAG: RNA 2'-phosphotransferase [Deltaproteobacteria bacterium]|nr:RNA 2'-phosphotransferase [Deltaproteobacteria bacterium]MBW2019786.1 RNA 2'-phosphotransferase [Deltaproteobacteria bacterium]MBW2074666.1 RNA 2'-phosphotransferase [Deltaproteobacteria bacterium]RLB83484.1 MAG: hypothetical protein DRH17_02395 [Deltaproteobacteria bacterium]
MGRGKDPKQLGKLMSYILGRRPDEFGLVPDDQGFVRLKELLKAITEEPRWGYVRKSHIHEVLMTSSEEPFVLKDDKIKATCQDDALNPEEGIAPPKLLYHCVRRRAYPVVCQHGIIPLGQARVFLATTQELAQRMGKRRDPAPVLLTIQAQRAFEAGVKFSKQGEFIYITDHVPVGYFTGPPLPKEKREAPKPKKEPVAHRAGVLPYSSASRPGSRPVIPEERPGSFTFDMERSRTLQQQRLRRKGLKKEIAWKKDVRRLRRKRER